MKTWQYSDGRHDSYVAAPTQKAAFEAFGISRNELKRFGGDVVSDKRWRWLALRNPGVVYVKGGQSGHVWRRGEGENVCEEVHRGRDRLRRRRAYERRVRWGLEAPGAPWELIADVVTRALPDPEGLDDFGKAYVGGWRGYLKRAREFHPRHTLLDEARALFEEAYRDLAHAVTGGYSHVVGRMEGMAEAQALADIARKLVEMNDYGTLAEIKIRVPHSLR